MRSIITAGVLLILIIITVVGTTMYTNRLSEDLLGMLDELEDTAEQEDWQGAADIQSRIRQRWDESEQAASMLFEHNVLQSIETSFARMDGAISEGESIEVLLELCGTKYMLEMLQKRLECSWENIF